MKGLCVKWTDVVLFPFFLNFGAFGDLEDGGIVAHKGSPPVIVTIPVRVNRIRILFTILPHSDKFSKIF